MHHAFSRSASITLLLVSSIPVHAQTLSSVSQVPVRALSIELAEAQKGTPAYIHTPFGTGNGFYLHEKGIVVTALHTVLTPSGDVAEAIDAGIRLGPLDNISEQRLAVVAQDPVHDLMLLRLVNGPPTLLAAEDEESRAVLQPPACKPQEQAVSKPKRTEKPKAARPAWRDVVQHTYIRHPATAAARNPGPPVRVVWDGPNARP